MASEVLKVSLNAGVTNSESVLLNGVNGHTYTILSIIITETAGAAETFGLFLDPSAGGTDYEIISLATPLGADETFVFNDSFSFNGHEPTNFTGPMDDATKQNAIADQGSSVAQKLQVAT